MGKILTDKQNSTPRRAAMRVPSAVSTGRQLKRLNSKANMKERLAMKRLVNKKSIASVRTTLRRKQRKFYNPKEEARLERIVFGDPTDIIHNLPSNEHITSIHEDVVLKKTKARDRVAGHSGSVKSKSIIKADVLESHTLVDKRNQKKAAWIDEDDIQYTVDIAFAAKNRKPPEDIPETSYTELLQNKYKQIVGTPKWAAINRSEEDEDLDSDILKHSCHLEAPKAKYLPKNVIEIKALKAINRETHIEGPIVSSLEFHPTSTVALAAGDSGILSIFQVDGVQNNKLHSMKFKKFPISQAKFLRDGTEILVGSQYFKHCYSYNLLNDKTCTIPLPHGITNMKRYEVSPDGKLIALCGRWGEISLLTSSSKELIATLKMNTGKCTAMTFSPDGKTLISHGDSSEMYIWDINSRTCIHRAIDDGCLSSASIDMSANGQFLATGSKQGVVNIYDAKTVLREKYPVPLNIVLNLVTSVTSLKFNPTSEILAIASDKKANAFRMVHIPSFTVFKNFPTPQTQMSMPVKIDFSPGSGYLGVSNNTGSALLYRLKHYGNY